MVRLWRHAARWIFEKSCISLTSFTRHFSSSLSWDTVIQLIVRFSFHNTVIHTDSFKWDRKIMSKMYMIFQNLFMQRDMKVTTYACWTNPSICRKKVWNKFKRHSLWQQQFVWIQKVTFEFSFHGVHFNTAKLLTCVDKNGSKPFTTNLCWVPWLDFFYQVLVWHAKW